MRPLLVGHSPVAGTVGETFGLAFVRTDSGRRLAQYAGLRDDLALMDHFDMINLYSSPDPLMDRRVERRRAQLIELEVVRMRYARVVLFSAPVAEAFGLDYRPLFHWWPQDLGGWEAWYAVCPHPSGLVRWWNDEDNVAEARAFFDRLVAVDA